MGGKAEKQVPVEVAVLCDSLMQWTGAAKAATSSPIESNMICMLKSRLMSTATFTSGRDEVRNEGYESQLVAYVARSRGNQS
jgi:hypothetical protein